MGFLWTDDLGVVTVAEFRLLGPVEVWAAGRRIDAGQPRQRSVLAALLADAGRSVPVETLIDRVWGAAPPRGARAALHGHITRIRQVLQRAGEADGSAAAVVFASNCYLLDIEEVAVDLHRFRSLAARARAEDCPPGQRVELLRQAMSSWHGEPMSGLAGAWVEQSREAWWQQYLDTAVAWAGAELEAGDPGAVIDVLHDLAERFPLTESVTAVLMRALAGAGRPADALTRYEDTRRRLREELGTDPGSDLLAVHQAILRGDQTSAPARALRALPADVAGFVGRGAEMKHLLAEIEAATATGRNRTVAIHAVDGMAGVGKTAFAVHVAHHLAERFPDGQQFVGLRAHAPSQERVDPATALETLLQADGVAPKKIPSGVDARAALWRERMAGKRLLLVLDDAADVGHVAPLLPAAPGCLVLITSRRKLTTLPGATMLSLDTLPHADAVALFAHRAGPRAHHDPAAVERIIRLCGRLPLAIILTAARLHLHPAWTAADLADDLEQAHHRLAELASGDLAVAAAFELSYRDLTPELRRLFRRLALHPGPDLDTHAAAALDGTTRAAVRRSLEQLLEHNLITEPHRGRYRFHDLIAEHARTHAAGDPAYEREAAVDRLLSYYLHTADAAAQRQAREAPVNRRRAGVPGPSPADAPTFATVARADEWLTAEQANLVAVVEYAAGHAHPAAVVIPAALHQHLRRNGPLSLAARLHRIAATTAQRLGDVSAQAHALADLANMHHLSGDYPAAIADVEQAHDLYRRLGDRRGQADTQDTLAHVRYAVGDYAAATAVATRASELYEEVGDRRGQAHILRILAWVRLATGDYPAAAANLDRTRALFRQLDDQPGEANTLDVLARVQIVIGDYPAATATAEHAKNLYQQLGSRQGEANTLEILACVQTLLGDLPAAIANVQLALALAEQIGNRHGSAVALRTLAQAQRLSGDHAAATANAEQSLALYEELSGPLGQANALQVLGVIQHETGDWDTAATTLRRALELFREVGDPDGEAETLNHIGQLLLGTADAERQFREALRIARRLGTPLHEARALQGIGHCLLHEGRSEQGVRHLRDALAIHRRLGTPEAAAVEAALDQVSRA